jgi:aminoglycoside phosphotransferase (APT) family kinase protein
MEFSALDEHQDMLSPGTPDIARLREDAIPLLTQLDAQEQLHTQKVVPLPAGMWNALYRLDPAGVVAKLSVGDNAFEVNFLRKAGELSVPVPLVSGAGRLEHPTLQNVTYFLMSYIPNCLNAWPLSHTEGAMTVDKLRMLGAELGQALAKLHTVHLGYITRFGTKVSSWRDTLTDGFSPDWDHIAPNALFDATLLPILETALRKTDYFTFQDGTLIHCDLNLSNVLVDAETHRLRAILDPAGYAGMPMFDLAYASMPWDYGFEFYQAMLDSYQHHSDKFDAALFYTSILVVAYRHNRFHTTAVRDSIFRDILPKLGL